MTAGQQYKYDRTFGLRRTVLADYDITITTLGGAAPADGFIDSKKLSQYMTGSTVPASLASAKAKSRGYARYKHLVNCLCQFSALGGVISTTTAGATIDTAPGSIVLRVRMGNLESMSTQDELNAGQVLVGLAALERIVARSLIAEHTPYVMELYDVTTMPVRDTDGSDTAAQDRGMTVISDSVGALAASLAAAEAAITIAAV